MSNTETKIKEMDMSDSLRCIFFNHQEMGMNHIQQGHTCTHTLVKSHNLCPKWLTIDCLSSKVSENDKHDTWLFEEVVPVSDCISHHELT